MTRLECKIGGHNKFYEFHFVKKEGRISVTGFYGRIGQAPISHPLYDGDNEGEALAVMRKKQMEKQKKGYVVVGDSNGSPLEPSAQKKRTKSP